MACRGGAASGVAGLVATRAAEFAVVAGLLVSRVVPGQPGLLGIGGFFLLSWG